MQLTKQLRVILPASVLLLSLVVAAPALAERSTNGGSGSTEPNKTTTEKPNTPPATKPSGSDSTETHKSAPDTTTTPKTDTSKADGESNDDSTQTEVHKRGADKVAELRKEKKTESTTAERQKRCESHKQGIETKFSKLVANSQRAQARIDEIFSKAQAFQASKNLSVANYNDLVAAATAAQANSAAAISALQAVQPTLDCTNPDVANDVATFKAAAEQTRTALKSYKTAVKSLLTSLKAAAKATPETTTKPATGGTN